jgi:Fe-S cluster assembly ATP-binding protein
MFDIQRATISLGDKKIVDDVSLTIPSNQLHVLMGPNGSGKSTLSLALAGHPDYMWDNQSRVAINEETLLEKSPDERAKMGLFLTFQHPVAVPGISVKQLVKSMMEKIHPNQSSTDILTNLKNHAELLHIKDDFLSRSIHDGFSGGEQKRLEMLQLLMARPKVALLDEIDSGLDVDAIKTIATAIEYAKKQYQTSFLIVTHYHRIVSQLPIDKVHIMSKGKIIVSGTDALINQIETEGYAAFQSTP